MFQRIVVTYNESLEAERALAMAIGLAKSLNAELHSVTVMAEPPAYTAYARVADPSLSQTLEQDRASFHRNLGEKARALALRDAIELQSHVVEGHGVDPIVEFLHKHNADLLVVGLHERDLYIARLWSTVYELAHDAPCSVLGVH